MSTPVLDLEYAEDSAAETDANFVITGSGGLVEVQDASARFVGEATSALGGLGFFLRTDRSIWTYVDGHPLLVRRGEHWTAFPVELTDGTVALAWARDDDGLRDALDPKLKRS